MKVLTLLMSLYMFVLCGGINIDLHYCRGEIKTFSMYGKARSCHESKIPGKKANSCPYHKDKSSDDKDCCKNESQLLKLDADQNLLQLNYAEIDCSSASNQWLFNNHFAIHTYLHNSYERYEPPPPDDDLIVRTQSFLL